MALGRVRFSTNPRGCSTTRTVLCNACHQREIARVLTALDLHPAVAVVGGVIQDRELMSYGERTVYGAGKKAGETGPPRPTARGGRQL
jgi:hypothetical protein